MTQSRSSDRHGFIVLVGAASFVVVVAGLKAAAPILVPVLMALFFSLLCVPPMRRLERHGVPTGVAIGVVILGATILVVLVSAVIGSSIDQFQGQIGDYRARLDAVVHGSVVWLDARGVHLDPDLLTGQMDTGAIMQLVGDTASSVLSALSNLLLVVLMMVFMLLEAAGLSAKLRRAIGDPTADLSEFRRAADRVHEYLAIKSWISLVTGGLVTALCAAAGVDFPLLWGLIAFLFNFVPNIGSIIAAIPAILLAALQFGLLRAALVGAGYLAINMVIGNIIEPRLMGRRLGLSTLVVFLSMLFWGWVWGPVGMLLSAPLTVIIKIALEHSADFQWLAVMLGPEEVDLLGEPDDAKGGRRGRLRKTDVLPGP